MKGSRVFKRGRNELCWCGSGLKYKRCHLNRASETPVSIQEGIEAFNQTFGTKYCIHPKAGAECVGNIVKAHTIQKKGFGLTRIARNGQVYGFRYDGIAKNKSFGAKLIHINAASTFTGFCGFHDNSTFLEVETKPFSGNAEQSFLLGYRAIAKELFLKRAQLEQISFLRTCDKGRDASTQQLMQRDLDYWEEGVSAGAKEIEHHNKIYERGLIGSDYSDERFYIIELDHTPDFMCSGTTQPEYDFEGNLLQDLSETTSLLDHITFSLIATDTGGAAVFSWYGENKASERLIKSLHLLTDEQIPHAVARYVFEFYENVYAAPEWWEGLDAPTQKTLLARLLSSLETIRAPSCLIDDSLQVVEWKVTSRKTNLAL
jgi:hypothetical protein